MSATAIITRSHYPLVKNAGKDALDLALLFGSYEQQISLFFIGDGVYHLLQGQSPAQLAAKDYLATYNALSFYDIEHVYVCQQSLQQRQLNDLDKLLNDIEVLSIDEIKSQLNLHKTVFTF